MDSSGETEPASSVSDVNENKSNDIIDFEDDFELEEEQVSKQAETVKHCLLGTSLQCLT